MTTPRAPRILFATIAAGGAHVSTAHAMAQAVGRLGAEARVYEPMVEYGFTRLDARHKASWRRMLARPGSIVWGQRLIDAVPRLTVQLHRWLLDGFARVAAERIAAEDADLVVVNHGWLTVALTRAQRRYGLATPVLTYETSTMNANALWADPDLERCVTASPRNAEGLARRGVPADRIDVVGYPVREAFLHAPDKRAARQRLDLDEDAFTVLVTFGSEGIGSTVERVLAAIRALGPEVQPLVVTGRNADLRATLRRAHGDLPLLRVEGFVPELGEHVAAADVVVTKTGPATVYEALAVGRPILAPERFGMAENRMSEMLARSGLGGEATTSAELAERLARYGDDPDLLAAAEAKAAAFDFAGMAERLGRYLEGYARTRQVPSDTLGRGLPWTS
jgi:UDP-N-acetylglucosamine:LPS N-acetylglucosamine transferase